MQFRKFYDPQTGEPAASAQPEVKPRVEITGEPITLEEVYAGWANQDIEEEKLASEPENKEEEPVVETPTEPEKKEEVVVSEEPIVPPPPIEDWRDIIKKQDKQEVYKVLDIDESILALSQELSQDDFVKKMLIYRKENGNLTPFIEAATKDWDKVSDVDLLRGELKKQYSKLSDEKFEKLAKAEIDKRFFLGEYSEGVLDDDIDLAKIRLETEADKIRSERKSEQLKFIDSVKPIDRTEVQNQAELQRQDDAKKEFEAWKSLIENNPATVKLSTEKKITLGKEGKSFNYSVNPDSIKEKTLDANKFYSKFWEKNSEGNDVFNFNKWAKVVAYAENTEAFEEALINNGISLGTKDIVEKDLVNATPPANQAPNAKAKSLARAFAEEGRPMSPNEISWK